MAGRGKEGKMSSISEVQPQIRKEGSEREKDRQTERLRQRERATFPIQATTSANTQETLVAY